MNCNIETKTISVTKDNPSEAPSNSEAIIDILVEPAMRGKKVIHGKYDTWDEDGRAIVVASLNPFCDSARKLLKRGVPTNAILRMHRLGSETYDLCAPIIVAAGLRVIEGAQKSPCLAKWNAFSQVLVERCSARKEDAAPNPRTKQIRSNLAATSTEMTAI